MAFIKGAVSGKYINHNYSTGEVVTSSQNFDTTNGVWDGTLWRIVDAGGDLVFIQGVGGYINHSYIADSVSLSSEHYDSTTGAYDGTLWQLVDAGNGRVLLKGARTGKYINHSYITDSVSVSSEGYDSATGAYDGTLWCVVAAYRITTDGVQTPDGFDGTDIKNESGIPAVIMVGQVPLEVLPGSSVEISPVSGQVLISGTCYEINQSGTATQIGQVEIGNDALPNGLPAALRADGGLNLRQ